jgi:AbrB family looped-hinge helix DNA binding protein
MNVQKGKIVSGGRLQLPAEMRKQLGLEEGDAVLMEVVNNELRIRSQRESIKRIQELLKPLRPNEGEKLMSEELIADRRKEAENE